MTVPVLLFEVELGGVWVDLTSYVVMKAGVSVTRGRENEQATTSPGVCNLTLRNDDGRFTPGLVTGAHYPNVRRMVRARLSVGGVLRFTGYVDAWTVTVTRRARKAFAQVRMVDRATLDGLRALQGMPREAILKRTPLAYWDLTRSTDAAAPGAGPLVVMRSGTGEPTLDWGGGETLPGDDAPGVRFTPAVSEAADATAVGGYRLQSEELTLPAAYTVVLSYGSGTTGPLLRLGPIALDMDAGKAVWKSGADMLPLVGNVEVISVSAAGVVLSSDTEGTVRAAAGSWPSAMVGATTTSWANVAVSHLAILPGGVDVTALLAEMAGHPMAASDALELLFGLSGAGAVVPTILGAGVRVVIPLLSGQSAQSTVDQLSTSALARAFVGRDGVPVWQSFDYTPAPVALPVMAGPVVDDMAYGPDLSVYVTDVTTTLPGGGTYTVSDATGLDRPSLNIEGVLPTAAECRAVASWLVEASTDEPRLSGVGVDLLPLSAGDVSTLLALDVGSRLTLGAIPAQVPAPGVLVVEGITEAVSDASWRMTFTTSPSPAVSWFAWGDAWQSKLWKPI